MHLRAKKDILLFDVVNRGIEKVAERPFARHTAISFTISEYQIAEFRKLKVNGLKWF